MVAFSVRRLALLFPMMFAMSVVAFAIIQAPPGDYLDDYVSLLAQEFETVDKSELEALRKRYGLDQPIYVQYLKWVWGILQWDLGRSFDWNRPASELINERLLMTVILGLFTITFTWTLAIPIGIVSAVKQYTIIDYVFTFLSYLGVGTPNFLLALVMMWVAFAYFGWCWTHGGQTLGMRAWRLRICALGGGLPTWRQCAVRFLAAIVSWACAGAGFAWILLDAATCLEAVA